MRAALLMVVLLAGCGVQTAPRADTGSSRTGDVIALESAMPDFVDHMERYKGKTLRGKLMIFSDIRTEKGDSLRKYEGREVKFFGHVGGRLDISIKMPSGDLPNAAFGDEVVVTFICKEGRLDSGNEAIKVERP